MSKLQRRVLTVLAIAAWVVIATVGVGWALLIELLDSSYCESGVGDSNFGELSWSVLPPGPVCTWTEASNGFADTSGPTPVMTAWLLTLVATGWLIARLRRPVKRVQDVEARPTAPAHSVPPQGRRNGSGAERDRNGRATPGCGPEGLASTSGEDG